MDFFRSRTTALPLMTPTTKTCWIKIDHMSGFITARYTNHTITTISTLPWWHIVGMTQSSPLMEIVGHATVVNIPPSVVVGINVDRRRSHKLLLYSPFILDFPLCVCIFFPSVSMLLHPSVMLRLNRLRRRTTSESHNSMHGNDRPPSRSSPFP